MSVRVITKERLDQVLDSINEIFVDSDYMREKFEVKLLSCIDQQLSMTEWAGKGFFFNKIIILLKKISSFQRVWWNYEGFG